MQYIVRASDLYQRAKEILNDGMEFVELDFLEGDDELPPCISFSAWHKGDLGQVDYDEIETVDTADAFSESVE